MTWLLGQILLSLLLAGIAGWYIGWALRGFTDGEKVGDLRRTLRATEEVKDREIAEANRRAEQMAERNERLARDNERLVERIEERRDWAVDLRPPTGTTNAGDAESDAMARASSVATIAAELPEPEAESSRQDGTDGESERGATAIELDLESRLAEAQAREQDQGRALREKTAAVLALQAELAKLRQAAEKRAREMAQVERRIVELEPLEERAAEGAGALQSARAAADAAETERDRARERAAQLEQEIERLRDEIGGRDVRINELRNRYQSVAAELEERQAEPESAGTAAPPAAEAGGDLVETRRLLQRQIERNRKQDAVHRQVVSSLQQQVADLEEKLRAQSTPGLAADRTESARWQQVLAERDSRIIGLRRRVVALEQAGEIARSDDLRQIYGIGPKIADRLRDLGVRTYAQIAAWDDAEIDRYSRELGDRTGRIRRDGWVESARELERIEIDRSDS